MERSHIESWAGDVFTPVYSAKLIRVGHPFSTQHTLALWLFIVHKGRPPWLYFITCSRPCVFSSSLFNCVCEIGFYKWWRPDWENAGNECTGRRRALESAGMLSSQEESSIVPSVSNHFKEPSSFGLLESLWLGSPSLSKDAPPSASHSLQSLGHK